MPEITDLTQASTSSAQEAASNIQTATALSMQPTADKDMNNQMSPQVQQLLKPTEATPAVHEYMSQGTEQTALAHGADPANPAASDVPVHSFIDDTTKYIGDIIYNRPTDHQKILDLAQKKMEHPDQFTDEDTFNLWQLNQDRAASPQAPPGEAPSYPVQLGKEVGQSLLEMGRGLRKNAPLIATFTGVGAGIGAVRGEGLGAIPGALLGLRAGVTASFAIDAYNSGTYGTYNELSATKMDEDTKKTISRGVGLTSALIMGAAGHIAAKATPFLNTVISPKLVAMAMQDPANAVLKITLNNIGQSVAALGAGGALTEATKIFSEQYAQTYDGSEASFLNALKLTSDNLAEKARRVRDAAVTGAATGLALGAVTGVAGLGQTRAMVENIGDVGRDIIANTIVTKGRPAGYLGVNDSEFSTKSGTPPPETEPPRAPPKDVTPKGSVTPEDSVSQSVKVLRFQDAMNDVTEAQKQTKMNDLAPEEMASMMKKVFDRAGISKLYTGIQSLRNWATTEEKGKAARSLINPVLNVRTNAPFEVDPVKVAEVAKTDPTIWEHMQITPEGPNPAQARTHLEAIQKANEDRAALMTKLGIKPEDALPADDSNVVPIGEKAAAEKVPFDVEAHVRAADTLLTAINNPDVTDAEKTKLQASLEDVKSKVTEHLQGQKPGDLLIPQFGQWPEPNSDTSSRAASEYINEPTFTEAIQQALPKAEVQKFNIAQQNARKSVVDNIKDSATYEMEQVQDIQVEAAKEARLQMEQDRIANDPNYAVVDKIRSAARSAKETKTNSIYAIDPRTLPNNLLKFTDDPRIKERGIFKKGGDSADNVAQLLGVKDGAELLKILAKTPTREQVAKARAQANAVADEKEARDSVDLNHTRIIEALRENSANHIAEMKFMREQEWPATKSGFKRIALPLPSIEEITGRAKGIIKKTKVGSLNPNQYRVGERQSMRIAVNSILKNEVAKAFQAKENAALNSELLKETLIATARVNRGTKFMRKLNSKNSQSILRGAGPLINNAMKEITNLINFRQPLTGNLPAGIEDGSTGDYLKWATKEVKEGRGDFSIPEGLLDTRQNFNDLTTEQFLTIVDRARVIFQEAKLVGRLIDNNIDEAQKEESWNVDRVVEKIIEESAKHPSFSDKKLKPVQGQRLGWGKVKYTFASVEELIAPKQNIYRELDRGNTGGFFQRTLDDPTEGAGKYYEKSGFTYLKKINKWIDSNLDQITKAHGNVNSFEGKFLKIPEFENIPELNNGVLTKGDLMAAIANRGQQYTKDMLTANNGGVDDTTWQKVLDRELEEKDVQYVQSLVDLYKNEEVIRGKTRELQEREGREVQFIEGVPYMHRGIQRAGGYIRVRTVHDYTLGDAKRAKDMLEAKSAAFFEKDNGAEWGRQYAAETTEQGYLVSRVGNKEPISLSLHGLVDGLREIAHDHAYREPLKNFFTIMNHPDTIPSMIRAVGEQKVNTLISTNLEIAGRPSAAEAGYFTNPNRTIKTVMNKFGGNFASSVIWANMSATIKQFEALPEMFNALGPKSVIHFASVNLTMLRNLDKMHGFIKSAADLDPNISKYIDNVNDDTVNVINKLVPRKGQVVERSLVGQGYEFVKVAGFFPHQMADLYTKVLQAHTVVKHVMAGDHPNYPIEKLNEMTEQEQFEAVQSIVQQMSNLTQIQSRHELKAPIQKNLAMKPWTFFWNYPRNILNNTIMDTRRAAWKASEGFAKLQGGGGGGKGPRDTVSMKYENPKDEGGRDYKGAAWDFGSAANMAMSRICWNVVGAYILAYAAGKTVELTRKIDWKDPKDILAGGLETLGNLMHINFEHTISTAPIFSAINYALEKRKKYQMAEVQDPYTQGLSSIATCMPAIRDMLSLSRHPNRMQMRACLEAESYVFVSAPVRAYYKSVKWMDDHSRSDVVSSEFQAHFNTAQVDNFQKDLKQFVQEPGEAPKELVAQADALHKQLLPVSVEVPAHVANSIKFAESDGQWNRPNGLYGFTSGDWKSIMRAAPNLGLTENGRISRDTSQQEKAIEFSLHENAVLLAEKDLPVNSTTLYGSHLLGVPDYEKVFKTPADTKLKTVLSADTLKEHPEFSNLKTIGQVKSYISGKIEQGRKTSEGDNKLTSPTANNED